MLDGSGSNKYKSINYVKLRALVSENKDYLLKTAVKLHKINNISQCNKDRAILKQHQLIWQKEFLHLLHLKRKVLIFLLFILFFSTVYLFLHDRYRYHSFKSCNIPKN